MRRCSSINSECCREVRRSAAAVTLAVLVVVFRVMPGMFFTRGMLSPGTAAVEYATREDVLLLLLLLFIAIAVTNTDSKSSVLQIFQKASREYSLSDPVPFLLEKGMACVKRFLGLSQWSVKEVINDTIAFAA